ncbi:DUF624 domain-containing protein [Actinomyces sp. MRS3W]|uniref:DUF624 domain-containing protein n=1 Tax=Actinomyces sp. MRS3W TaxID=2800796 RepID=UPI0028FD0A0F|nr:DUF624 domain-containing protein [Actinomyces sp. MRS3W]MDU0348721.1 DUF624 domain-containing protein [Actinomyces sp. MRS3W]
MGWLRVATQLVALNLLWWLGLLPGLVLFGVLPASCAVHELARRSRRDPSMHLWHDFWSIYRTVFRNAARPGAVLTGVMFIGAVDLAILSRAQGALIALIAPVTVICVMCLVTLCYAVVLLASPSKQEPKPLLRRAAGAAVASPPTTLAVVVTVAGAACVAWCWPLLGVLVGVSLPLAAATLLTRERLRRIGALPELGNTASY